MTDRLKEWLDNHLAWNDEDVDVAVAALRAVVELHKPHPLHGWYCIECEDSGAGWPCRTIRAIEKEVLK